MSQITNNIMMIRPVAFRFNEQTAINNYYQKNQNNLSVDKIHSKTIFEFDNFVNKLRNIGVNVIVINDNNNYDTPDSIFPNNWISFHQNNSIVVYPMNAENRRNERRKDIFKILNDKYLFNFKRIYDYSKYEKNSKFLEGTGSMVLDRVNKICYAAISERTNKSLVKFFCKEFKYKDICFSAYQNVLGERKKIYHTNVMMCIADKFAIVCLDAVEDLSEKKKLVSSIQSTGKEIISITRKQKNNFAGNMLQVLGNKPHIVMSKAAYLSLTSLQKEKIQKYCPILYSDLQTIETFGGGSARCMMAEIFLSKK